jgi:hypothetical protein
MLLTGFVGIGLAGYRKRRNCQSVTDQAAISSTVNVALDALETSD